MATLLPYSPQHLLLANELPTRPLLTFGTDALFGGADALVLWINEQYCILPSFFNISSCYVCVWVWACICVHMCSHTHACVCVCLCVWCMHLSYVHTQARTEVPLPSLLLSAFCLKAGHSLNQLFAVARLASQHTLRPRPSSPPCAGVAGRSSHINFYTGAVDLNSGPHACETSTSLTEAISPDPWPLLF